MPSPNQITVSQLSRLIGTPECPPLVDVCIDEDFNDDPRLVPGAFRHPFTDITALANSHIGKRVIVICQKGKKLSAGAAALLRAQGVNAEYLEGGNYAWRDAELPFLPAPSLPNKQDNGSMLFVTRHRPKIDRIACPWLIRRFVDPTAQFMFVAPAEVEAVAEKFNATPFDIEGVFWSHREEKCTFDTMIEEWNLHSPALDKVADIVRGADTNRHDLSPEVAGLLAMSVGLSRMYRDDLKQLDAGMIIYDALYRWARDAQDETHDWPTSK